MTTDASSIQLPHDWASWSLEARNAYFEEIRYNWRLWARPSQLPPEGDWDEWLVLAGRGFGKTRAGVEFIRENMETTPGCRAALIGPTYAAVRDTIIEGESGILASTPAKMIKKYNRSLMQIRFTNGSLAFAYSGNDPEKLRGPQHHVVLADELCSWQYPQETWDMAQMGLRLGDHPRVMITTTPKPIPLIVDIMHRSISEPGRVVVTKGSTFDNAANLPSSTIATLRNKYEGTHLGRQELYADLILDQPGALWNRELIDKYRIDRGAKLPEMLRMCVAVDPSMSSTAERPSETGIVVGGLGADRHAYILADLSMLRPTPDQWALAAIGGFHEYKADKIVYETNQGGDNVADTLRSRDEKIPLRGVRASRGKTIRADPVSALYEQGKVHHVGLLPGLEDQLCGWVPGEPGPSPDRLDALVWLVTELLLGGGIGEMYVPSTSARLPSAVPGRATY